MSLLKIVEDQNKTPKGVIIVPFRWALSHHNAIKQTKKDTTQHKQCNGDKTWGWVAGGRGVLASGISSRGQLTDEEGKLGLGRIAALYSVRVGVPREWTRVRQSHGPRSRFPPAPGGKTQRNTGESGLGGPSIGGRVFP